MEEITILKMKRGPGKRKGRRRRRMEDTLLFKNGKLKGKKLALFEGEPDPGKLHIYVQTGYWYTVGLPENFDGPTDIPYFTPGILLTEEEEKESILCGFKKVYYQKNENAPKKFIFYRTEKTWIKESLKELSEIYFGWDKNDLLKKGDWDSIYDTDDCMINRWANLPTKTTTISNTKTVFRLKGKGEIKDLKEVYATKQTEPVS